jgi:hypothetical protein
MALPLLFALPTWTDAADATLRIKARLREGPSKQTTLLGWVEAGTVVEILEEKSGWRQIKLPDGRTGYVWGEHFTAADAAPPADDAPIAARAEAATPPSTAPTTAGGDDVRSLRSDLDALKARPEPATAAAVEQLRGEVSRLAAAQQELTKRLDARGPDLGGGPAPPLDGTASAAALFLAVGGFVGWIASRLMQRWRDRRSRIRI